MASRKSKPQASKEPARADSKEIVAAILGAAMELATEGIDGVSTNAIARRAGVGVASLYRYFPNKQAIYAELVRRQHHGYKEKVRAALVDGISLKEAVEATVKILLVDTPEQALRRNTLRSDIPLSWSEDEFREMNRTALKEIVGWLRRNMENVPDDIEDRVFFLTGTAQGIVQLRLIQAQDAPTDEAIGKWLNELSMRVLTPGGMGVLPDLS